MRTPDRDAPNARLEPQYQLSGVLGDYWFWRSEKLPSAALVELAADFGVTEASARQALRRLVLRGTLESAKEGRTTSYGFPVRSHSYILRRISTLVDAGKSDPRWDGRWTMVTFSVPEQRRDIRRSLRTRLRGFGFGSLHDAVWVSPHDRAAEAAALLDEFEVENGHVFRTDHRPRAGAEVDIARCYDLTELRRGYEEYIERYRSFPRDLPPEEAMAARSTVMFDWRSVRRMDPDLPAELLPGNWPRAEAYQTFLDCYQALGAAGEARFKDVVARHAPHLAPLARRHT